VFRLPVKYLHTTWGKGLNLQAYLKSKLASAKSHTSRSGHLYPTEKEFPHSWYLFDKFNGTVSCFFFWGGEGGEISSLKLSQKSLISGSEFSCFHKHIQQNLQAVPD